MYIYFDENGTLKEIISDRQFRVGDNKRDKIYIYWAGEHAPLSGWVKYTKPDGTETPETTFFELGDNLVGKALPTDPLRNLSYFSYNHTYIEDGQTKIGYKFYEVTVPEEILNYGAENIPTLNNMIIARCRFVMSEQGMIESLGEIVFSVETNVGILTDTSINNTQYNYLITLLSMKIGFGTNSVKVDELPSEGVAGTIYYVKVTQNENDIVYAVYIWNGTQYEFMGYTSYDIFTQYEAEQYKAVLMALLNERYDLLEAQIHQIGNASPKGVYATLADLEAAFPDGAEGVYVVTEDGKWYYWDTDTLQWTAGGTYQATELADGSITYSLLDSYLKECADKALIAYMGGENILFEANSYDMPQTGADGYNNLLTIPGNPITDIMKWAYVDEKITGGLLYNVNLHQSTILNYTATWGSNTDWTSDVADRAIPVQGHKRYILKVNGVGSDEQWSVQFRLFNAVFKTYTIGLNAFEYSSTTLEYDNADKCYKMTLPISGDTPFEFECADDGWLDIVIQSNSPKQSFTCDFVVSKLAYENLSAPYSYSKTIINVEEGEVFTNYIKYGTLCFEVANPNPLQNPESQLVYWEKLGFEWLDGVKDSSGNLLTVTDHKVQLSKAAVGLGNVDNTSDLDKPISTATQNALDLKVPITRTVNGHALSTDITITKADVGLGNVDNTSDLNKPISTATQTALNSKAVAISSSIDSDYKMTLVLKDANNNTISSTVVDLPLEQMIVSASYSNGVLTLTLDNGQTLDVDISDIISGLVPDSRTIAGISLASDIAADTLTNALVYSNTTTDIDYVMGD